MRETTRLIGRCDLSRSAGGGPAPVRGGDPSRLLVRSDSQPSSKTTPRSLQLVASCRRPPRRPALAREAPPRHPRDRRATSGARGTAGARGGRRADHARTPRRAARFIGGSVRLDPFQGGIAKESWNASRNNKTTTHIKPVFDWIYGGKPSYISDVPGGRPEAGNANRAQKKERNNDSAIRSIPR